MTAAKVFTMRQVDQIYDAMREAQEPEGFAEQHVAMLRALELSGQVPAVEQQPDVPFLDTGLVVRRTTTQWLVEPASQEDARLQGVELRPTT